MVHVKVIEQLRGGSMPPGLFTAALAHRETALASVRAEAERLLGKARPGESGASAEEAPPPEAEPEPEPEESSEDEEVRRQEADRQRLVAESAAREALAAELARGEGTRGERIEELHRKLDGLNERYGELVSELNRSLAREEEQRRADSGAGAEAAGRGPGGAPAGAGARERSPPGGRRGPSPGRPDPGRDGDWPRGPARPQERWGPPAPPGARPEGQGHHNRGAMLAGFNASRQRGGLLPGRPARRSSPPPPSQLPSGLVFKRVGDRGDEAPRAPAPREPRERSRSPGRGERDRDEGRPRKWSDHGGREERDRGDRRPSDRGGSPPPRRGSPPPRRGSPPPRRGSPPPWGGRGGFGWGGGRGGFGPGRGAGFGRGRGGRFGGGPRGGGIKERERPG